MCVCVCVYMKVGGLVCGRPTKHVLDRCKYSAVCTEMLGVTHFITTNITQHISLCTYAPTYVNQKLNISKTHQHVQNSPQH